jgi:tripartite-type tricarboxylate transporter receptor subunit TctC
LAPEIPTIAEQGLPTFETDSWYGIIAPANTPQAVVERISLSFNEAMAREGVRQNLRERGIEIIGGTPAEFGQHLKREVAKYAEIVKTSNMKID